MALTRSAFLNRLRRAFLLRVHPDRFRNRSDRQRQQQAQLVQALSNRMNQPDFRLWQNHECRPIELSNQSRFFLEQEMYSFALEQRDGSLLRRSFNLNGSVDDIITTMVKALQACGAGASIPTLSTANANDQQRANNIHNWTTSRRDVRFSTDESTGLFDGGPIIESTTDKEDYHRYSVVSNKGRNLLHFITNGLDRNEVTKRKMARTDAQAAALAVRSLYKFQAVDATRLGWSSGNVAMLFKRLVELHEEYHDQFYVDSFYPLRLVFSSFDVVEERKYGSLSPNEASKREGSHSNYSTLDIYGGVLHLHPASTPVQWLVHLQQVTKSSLESVQERRSEIEQFKKLLTSRHNLKVIKGYSCSNKEFYSVVKLLCAIGVDQSKTISANRQHQLVAEALVVKVEATMACPRLRPSVSRDGSIQLSEAMCSDHNIIDKISQLGVKARNRRTEFDKEKELCQSLAKDIQWKLGLPRSVYRTGVIKQDDFLDSLWRMHQQLDIKSEHGDDLAITARRELAGTALAITGSGHFCHLADDGDVVIPHDWR